MYEYNVLWRNGSVVWYFFLRCFVVVAYVFVYVHGIGRRWWIIMVLDRFENNSPTLNINWKKKHNFWSYLRHTQKKKLFEEIAKHSHGFIYWNIFDNNWNRDFRNSNTPFSFMFHFVIFISTIKSFSWAFHWPSQFTKWIISLYMNLADRSQRIQFHERMPFLCCIHILLFVVVC